MLCFPSAPPLRDMWIIATYCLVLEDFQLHVESFQFRPNVVRTHVRQRDLTDVHVAIVARQWSVSIHILRKNSIILFAQRNCVRVYVTAISRDDRLDCFVVRQNDSHSARLTRTFTTFNLPIFLSRPHRSGYSCFLM